MSIYRKTVWFIKGMREYTKSGYEYASKNFNVKDLEVDCTGKSYMITGANSGIGKVAAVEIAKRGGQIFMVCRNKERGEEAQKEIIELSKNQNVHLKILDMSIVKNVIEFGQNFANEQERLDVLINNAGCMINEKTKTAENFEANFATNTMSTLALTLNLIPLLQKSQDKARIIIVSSGGMLTQKLNIDDPQMDKEKTFDGTMVYAQNKRQQIIITEQLAKRYSDLFFASYHPGWADTPAVRTSMPDFYNKMKNRLRTAEQGADTMVWLALAEAAVKNQNGLFYQDRQPAATHLTLARSRTTDEEDVNFMSYLEGLLSKL